MALKVPHTRMQKLKTNAVCITLDMFAGLHLNMVSYVSDQEIILSSLIPSHSI